MEKIKCFLIAILATLSILSLVAGALLVIDCIADNTLRLGVQLVFIGCSFLFLTKVIIKNLL